MYPGSLLFALIRVYQYYSLALFLCSCLSLALSYLDYRRDEDLSPTVAEMLRARGIDAISAHEAGNRGLSDWEQMDQAAGQSRCLVTRNRDDFIALTLRYYSDQLSNVQYQES